MIRHRLIKIPHQLKLNYKFNCFYAFNYSDYHNLKYLDYYLRSRLLFDVMNLYNVFRDAK